MSFTVLRKRWNVKVCTGRCCSFVLWVYAQGCCICVFFLSLVHFPLHNYPSLMERHGASKLPAVIRTPSKAASPYGNWRKYVTLLPAIVSAHVPRDTCIVGSGSLGFHFAFRRRGGREKVITGEKWKLLRWSGSKFKILRCPEPNQRLPEIASQNRAPTARVQLLFGKNFCHTLPTGVWF